MTTALTSTHEDYIELVFRKLEDGNNGVRITDIATELGCRLPTVTRTVKLLADEGFFQHESRGLVFLTNKGRVLAEEIAHRHDDVVSFLELVLGLPREQAELDACRIEHGISGPAAERLHLFMDRFEALPAAKRKRIRVGATTNKSPEPCFDNLVEVKAHGWRV